LTECRCLIDHTRTCTCAGNNVRNIYFPFDMVNDTATEVAEEMVKELEIRDRDPSEIAAMIEQEIERLLPGRKQQHEYAVYAAHDDDDDENEERPPPFYYLSSSPTSSQSSVCPYASDDFSRPQGGAWSKGNNVIFEPYSSILLLTPSIHERMQFSLFDKSNSLNFN
jgi:hypothetical protein